ncbi:Uncharacterised protein [Bordetella pertussis]|nr:Uncharacterised protein [Bordetella pertussis]
MRQQFCERRAAALHVAYGPDIAFHAGTFLQGQRCCMKRAMA